MLSRYSRLYGGEECTRVRQSASPPVRQSASCRNWPNDIVGRSFAGGKSAIGFKIYDRLQNRGRLQNSKVQSASNLTTKKPDRSTVSIGRVFCLVADIKSAIGFKI